MQNNYNPTATAVWQAAVAANEAALTAKGMSQKRAHELALKKARAIHPAAQAAAKRNWQMNADARKAQGGAA